MAATRCRPSTQVDSAVFTIVHIGETPPGALARAEPAGRRQARLRPVAAHRRRRGAARARLRQRRRDADAGRAQSGRRDLDRPAGAAARAGGAARSALRRRIRRLQARPHPRRDRKPARRRAGGLRPARGGLDLQHPRRRRRAHAAAARLRHRAAGGHARRSTSTAPSSATRCAHKLEEIAEVREPADFIRDLHGARRSAQHRAARPGDRRRRARRASSTTPAAR